MADLDYPVDAPVGIAPVIYRSMLLQAMAFRYFNYMKGSDEEFGLDEGFDAARATWDTEWPDDPSPRTMDAALQCVDDDLSYWGEE